MAELELNRNLADSHAEIELNLSASSADDFPMRSDILLPVQFHEDRRWRAEFDPLRRLMFAVLLDAVRCFQIDAGAHQHSKRREFAEAESWLFGANREGPFSFETVCDVLDIDPDCFRRGLLQWRDRKLAGEAAAPVGRRNAVVLTNRVTAIGPRAQRSLRSAQRTKKRRIFATD